MKDPVCGMTVTDKSFYHLEHVGQTHFFCGDKCKRRFAADMLRYTGVEGVQVAPPAEAAPEGKLKWNRKWTLALAGLVALILVVIWQL